MLLTDDYVPECRTYEAYTEDMKRGSEALLNALRNNPPKQKSKSAGQYRRLLQEESAPKAKKPWPTWYRPPGVREFAVSRLLADVAEDFGMTHGDIIGRNRSVNFIDARSVVVRILLDRGWSMLRIGRQLGGRDHKTISNLRDNFGIYEARNSAVPYSYERQRVRHGRL